MTTEAGEIWRPVVGYEGAYEVSDRHRVRSLERVVQKSNGATQTIRPRVRRLWHRGRVRHVTLLRDGRYQSFGIRGLVKAAFAPDQEPAS